MSVNVKKNYEKLIKVYSKRIKELDKDLILENFILQLQLLRDKLILTEDLIINGVENRKIATLATAIKEYQDYTNCINNYFIVTRNNVVPKENIDNEILMKQYNKEKKFHWEAFWSIVADNFETWKE